MSKREFVYSIQAVIQEPKGNVFNLSVDFDGAVDIDESGYYLPWEVTESGVANMMKAHIIEFLAHKSEEMRFVINYNEVLIRYNAVTNDPYVTVQFVTGAKNTLNTSPNIEAIIEPKTISLPVPIDFAGEYSQEDNAITWTWRPVLGCAYNIFNQQGDVLIQMGINKDTYIEHNLEPDTTYTRCISAFNTELESDPSDYVSITTPPEVPVIDINSNLSSYEINSPYIRHKTAIERRIERLPAFYSGIGDNLDLLVRHSQRVVVEEEFDFDIYFRGTEVAKVKQATECIVGYKTYACGYRSINIGTITDFILEVSLFPYYHVGLELLSYYYIQGVTKCDIECDITIHYHNPIMGWTNMNLVYTNRIEIDKPCINMQIADFQEWVDNHSMLIVFNLEPDDYEITNISIIKSTNPFFSFEIINNKLYVSCTQSNTFYEYRLSIDTDVYPDSSGTMILVEANQIIPVNAHGEPIPDASIIPTTVVTYSSISYSYSIRDNFNILYPTNWTLYKPSLRIESSPPTQIDTIQLKIDSSSYSARYKLISGIFSGLTYGTMYMLKIDKLSGSIGDGGIVGDEIAVLYNNSYYAKITYNDTSQLSVIGEDTLNKELWQNWWEHADEILVNKGGDYIPARTVLQNVYVPDDIEDVYYSIDIEYVNPGYVGVGNVVATLDHAYEPNKTRIFGDGVVISVPAYAETDVTRPWFGYSYTSRRFKIDTSYPHTIYEWVFNPLYDGSQQGRTISDVYVTIESNNPNVEVTSPEWDYVKISLGSYGSKIEIKFLARIVAPGQSAWNPLVHPGIYYINQDEYCLYADHVPEGDFAPELVPEPREVMITLIASVILRSREIDFEKLLYTYDELMAYNFITGVYDPTIDGTNPNRDTTVTIDGKIILNTDTSNVPYLVNMGEYFTPWLTFNYALSRIKLEYETIWPKEGRFGHKTVYIQYYDTISGNKTNWIPFDNNSFYLPKRNIYTYRFKFEIYRETQYRYYQESIIHKSQADWQGGTFTNMTSTNNILKAVNSSRAATYISPIIVLDTVRTNKMRTTVFANHTLDAEFMYDIYVAYGANRSDLISNFPWHHIENFDDIWQHQQFFRYRIVISEYSKTEIYSVNMDFHNDAYRCDYAPEFRNLRITGVPWEFSQRETIYKSFIVTVPMDKRYHDVTEYNLEDLVQSELLMSNYYDYKIESINVHSNDERVTFYYDKSGKSKLQAMCNLARPIYLNGKYIGITSPEGIGRIKPIPVQGRPVILWKEDYGYLQQVTFLDKDNKTVLDNIEYIQSDGRNVLCLGYKNIDTKRLKVIKYDTREELDNNTNGEDWQWESVIDNFIYFLDIIPKDIWFKVTYRIKDSFCVDYNEFSSIDKATVKVHLVHGYYDFTKMRIYYEVYQTDAWYHANRVEINPLYNPNYQGFFFLRDYPAKANSIEILRSPEILIADGEETRYFFIRVLDEYKNPVGSAGITINALHGKLYMRHNITNIYGIVPVKYTVPKEEVMDIDTSDWYEIINVAVPSDDVYHEEIVRLYRPGSDISVQISIDKLSVTTGELITLNIKAFRDTLIPITGLIVTIILASYKITGTTNGSGIVALTVPAIINYHNSYCRIKIIYGYQQQYYKVKVV